MVAQQERVGTRRLNVGVIGVGVGGGVGVGDGVADGVCALTLKPPSEINVHRMTPNKLSLTP